MNLLKSLTKLAKRAGSASLVVVAALGFIAMPAIAKDPIRIGAVTSATGPGSFLGDPGSKALKLMIEQVNQQGGVLGRQLELVLYDDASNPERARSMMQRLLTQDRVSVVIGSSLTANSMVMETLAARHGVPQVALAGGGVLTNPVKKWLFTIPESDVIAAQVSYEGMKKSGISKIALLSSAAGVGRASRETYIEQAKKYNIEVVMDETYAAGDSDMSAQLTRIRGNRDVQAIVNLDAGNQPAIVARNYAALGIKLPLYTLHSQAAAEFPELAGRAAEGIRVPGPAMVVAEQLPQGSKVRDMGLTFRSLYQKRYGRVPNMHAGYGHDAVTVVVDAIRRAGSTDPAAIRDAIEQTRDLVGVTSTFTYGPNSHGGIFNNRGMRLLEIRDGGFVLAD